MSAKIKRDARGTVIGTRDVLDLAGMIGARYGDR
jgi:hypothetical protein